MSLLCSLNDVIYAEKNIIPGSVTTIGQYEFYDCKTLKNINIPNNVTCNGQFAFALT